MNKYKKVLTLLYQDLIGSDIINLIILFIPKFVDPTEFINDKMRHRNECACRHHNLNNYCSITDISHIDGYDRYVKKVEINNPPDKIPFDKISRKIKHDYYWTEYLVIPDKNIYFNVDLSRVISKKPCQKEWGYIEMFCNHHNKSVSGCWHNMRMKTDEQKQQHKIECDIQRNNSQLGFKYLTYETFKEAAWRAKEMYYNQPCGSMYRSPKIIYSSYSQYGKTFGHPTISDSDLETIINDDTIQKNNDVIIRKVVLKMCDSN